MLTLKKLQEFKEYLESGAFIEDMEMRPPDGQAEMLDMIDLLFEICEKADEILSRHFYKKWGEGVFKKET
ncbi:hypothetical protein THC_1144 [Caldimicrobium thiodismutans]|jgi:hypothetical protein|uniref:Uncharacterized protein n=1 Tax=Caldimicrobium thiodismutans TaxID=1653476 RepID=A0A0U4W348_9BACT|nr:hypothetical protein [Caldimicrobium thiodismutans]BAU23517.1 hypothetical protein THC_1144 [Caldimicrobium thiodismutans]